METSGWGDSDYCPSVKSLRFKPGEEVSDKYLFVKVLHARGMTSSGEKEDPYAIFNVDGEKGGTKYITKDMTPTWNWGCWFRVEGNVKIEVKFWDKDFGRDDRIGYAGSVNGFTISEDTLKNKCNSDGVDGECKMSVAVVNEQGEQTGPEKDGAVILVFKYVNLQTRITDASHLTQ